MNMIRFLELSMNRFNNFFDTKFNNNVFVGIDSILKH